MYGIIEKAVLFVRLGFVLGVVIAAIFGFIKGRDVLLYGYLQGAVCVVALVCSKVMVVVFGKTIDAWVPGAWGGLTREAYEETPVIVKVIIVFQYISLFYLSFIFGWFVFSMIYYWIK